MKKIILVAVLVYTFPGSSFAEDMKELIAVESEKVFKQINSNEINTYMKVLRDCLNNPSNDKLDGICEKINQGEEAYLFIGIMSFYNDDALGLNENVDISGCVMQVLQSNPLRVIKIYSKVREVIKKVGLADKIKTEFISRLIGTDMNYNHRSSGKSKNMMNMEVLKDTLTKIKDVGVSESPDIESKNAIIRVLDFELQFFSEHYSLEQTRGIRFVSAILCTPSFLILNHYSIYNDGKWYVGLAADASLALSLVFREDFPNAFFWIGTGILFTYPIVNIIDGYYVKENGRVIRGWISLALGTLTLISFNVFKETGDTKYPFDFREFEDLSIYPVMDLNCMGLTANLRF